MEEEGTKIEVTIVGMLTLWVLGIVLLAWSTYVRGFEATAGRWAFFIMIVAATWTLLIGQARSRRRIVQGLRCELQLLRDNDNYERERRRLESI